MSTKYLHECPSCGSRDFHAHVEDWEASACTVGFTCALCGHVWQAHYAVHDEPQVDTLLERDGYTYSIDPAYGAVLMRPDGTRIRVITNEARSVATVFLNGDKVAEFTDEGAWSVAVPSPAPKTLAMTLGPASFEATLKAWYDIELPRDINLGKQEV